MLYTLQFQDYKNSRFRKIPSHSDKDCKRTTGDAHAMVWEPLLQNKEFVQIKVLNNHVDKYGFFLESYCQHFGESVHFHCYLSPSKGGTTFHRAWTFDWPADKALKIAGFIILLSVWRSQPLSHLESCGNCKSLLHCRIINEVLSCPRPFVFWHKMNLSPN